MIAGIATAVAGISLIIVAAFGQGVLTARMAAGAVVAAAIVELVAGVRMERQGAPGMAHVFAGALALFLALYVVATAIILPGSAAAPPIALALGLFCFCNAIFRAIDLFVDKPAGLLFEAIDVAFTFVIGAVLFAHWRSASGSFIGVAAGIELVSGGLALLGSAWAHREHPEEPAYDGRADRLARVAVKPKPASQSAWR